MLANWITLSRFPLLLVSILLLYLGTPPLRIAGAGVLFIGLMLDTVDGIVARRTGRTSLFGSVLDIAADRTYELVLWLAFADLRLVPAALPLIVIVRTTLTDALRSIGVSQGVAPFAQERTAVGRFLVGSAWMRTGYAVGKLTTFCGLAVALACSGYDPDAPLGALAAPLLSMLQPVAWVTVTICMARGLPVIVGSLRRHLIPAEGRGPDAPGLGEEAARA